MGGGGGGAIWSVSERSRHRLDCSVMGFLWGAESVRGGNSADHIDI